MYIIVFHYHDSRYGTESYGGGTYYYQGEKFAVLNNRKPKLYRSKGIAERSAQQLIKSCANVSDDYEIVETHKSFNEEHKTELREKIVKDEHTTDSDIEEYCDEHDLSRKDVFHYVAEVLVPDCCKGCKYTDHFNNIYPCNVCSRTYADFYEKEDK